MECFKVICTRHSLFVIMSPISPKSKQYTMEKLNKVIAVKFYETRWFWIVGIGLTIAFPFVILIITSSLNFAKNIYLFGETLMPGMLLNFFVDLDSNKILLPGALIFYIIIIAVILIIFYFNKRKIYIPTSIILITMTLTLLIYSYLLLINF